MRAAVLVMVVSLAPAAGAFAGETSARERRAEQDMREMREALATLSAVIEAVARPSGSAVDDAPWLLKESLRSGVVDPQAMGAIIRWVLYEKEEKVAAVFADALKAAEPRFQGVDGERYGAAARSVLSVLGGVLRDAQHNRRRNGDDLLRELRPAIDAAATALREVQQRQDGAVAPPATAEPVEPAPVPDGPPEK